MAASLVITEPSLFSLPTPETSLSSRAMLCALSISMWSARKHDPDASEEIARLHDADKDAGRYNKLLLPRKSLEEIQKLVSEARREHSFLSLPWADDGYRVLPAPAFMDHTEKMRGISTRFNQAVDTFVLRFEDLVGAAKLRLGTLFRLEDYPGIAQVGENLRLLNAADLRARFSFATNVMPLPDANDFRVQLGDQDKERIKRQITASVQASLSLATRELWQRLYDAVTHMADRLKAYKVTDEGVEHPFRDTVVTNLVKLVEVLPKLNISSDPALDRLTEEVRRALLVDVKDLRKDESVRTQTAQAAEEIARKMAGYVGILSGIGPV